MQCIHFPFGKDCLRHETTHPIETILINYIPMVIIQYYVRFPLFIYIINKVYALFNVMVGHSGYSSKFFHDSSFHNNHHKYFCVNYGSYPYLDKLFNTYYYSIDKDIR